MASNGLRSFGFHALAPKAKPIVMALLAERETAPHFAPFAKPKDLARLDPESAARHHLMLGLESESLPGFEAMSVNGRASEFRCVGTDAIRQTKTTMVRFRQEYSKIPVYGSLVTVELNDRNELVSISSALGEPANVDPIADVSPSDALATVRAVVGYDLRGPSAVPRLNFLYDKGEARWRLVYFFEDVARGHGPQEGPTDPSAAPAAMVSDFVVDAHTGRLVSELPRTASMAAQSASATDELGLARTIEVDGSAGGKTVLRSSIRNVETYDLGFKDWRLSSSGRPGTLIENPPDPFSRAGVSAHFNASAVVDFLRDTLGRNGVDGQGGVLRSSVNCTQGDPSGEWRNAAWISTQMIYGQRKAAGGGFRSYAVGLDIVGHEVFHGVTEKTARLEYVGESGALNESYSDIFGILISNFENADRRTWNFELGEELVPGGTALRDFSDPAKFQQPDHMSKFKSLEPLDVPSAFNDYGFVHSNSGIHNLAAYKVFSAVDSAGADLFSAAELASIFYVALQHLSRTSDFSASRRGVVLAATSHFMSIPAAARGARLDAIEAAFDAVGVE